MCKYLLKLIILCYAVLSMPAQAESCDDFTNVSMRKLHAEESINFCQFKDKPLLIVNTASNCGFTGQFKELEALHKKYKDKGLVVIGFPSDDFFQEENDEADTAEVCYINYGVTFTMLSTTAVRGDDANEIFKHLNKEAGAPKWNFYKYLVSADRKSVQRFNSRTKPLSANLTQAIENAL